VPCGGGRKLLEVVSVVYMQKWIHLVQKLRRNEYFQYHFLQVSFFAASRKELLWLQAGQQCGIVNFASGDSLSSVDSRAPLPPQIEGRRRVGGS
jgi:hypothetical protein